MKHGAVVVVPDPDTREAVCGLLRNAGIDVLAARDSVEAAATIEGRRFDLALLSACSEPSGVSLLLGRLRAADPGLEAVVLCDGDWGLTLASARQWGAQEIVTGPFRDESLRAAVERALERHCMARERERLRRGDAGAAGAVDLVGRSAAIERARALALVAARCGEPVLIVGEPGTGRRTVARIIHRESGRGGLPGFEFSCASKQPAALEGELFGRADGAFSTAGACEGVLERAAGSTLIMSDPAALGAAAQEKLEICLETRTHTRMGSGEALTTDVRWIVLATPELDGAVSARKLRLDLFSRLSAIRIDLPPLRARREDLPVLAMHFLERFRDLSTPPVTSIEPAAMRAMLAYDWPGNVKELERCIRMAVARASGTSLSLGALPAAIAECKVDEPVVSNQLIDVNRPLADVVNDLVGRVERAYLVELLRRCRGQISKVAVMSGLSRRGVKDKMERYGLDRLEFGDSYLFSDLKPGPWQPR